MPSSALSHLPAGNSTKSVNLCCSSGDGKAIFSLGCSNRTFFVERRTLPLHDEGTDLPGAQKRAVLPDFVQVSLALSSAVGLIYVEADSPQQAPKRSRQMSEQQQQQTKSNNSFSPTLLCVYTRKNAIYLELSIDAQGEAVVHAEEAFDRYLAADDAITILRIRPAPQRRMDFATLCPRGAMAMLTHHSFSNEYNIVLQHNQEDALVSIPVSFYLEELSGRDESISDFCFAQSDGLSLFSTMTVLLLKGSGDVLAASPVLFDASVVHRSALNECIEYLDYQIQNLNVENPKSKQCKTGRALLTDAFGGQDPHSNFVTARIISQAKARSAVTWPVQLQGPVLMLSRDNPEGSSGHAVVIENFSSSELVGVAVGCEGHAVSLGIMSPSCLLPRFSFETAEDCDELNTVLSNAGAVVQRLILNDNETGETQQFTNQTLALVRDPLMDSMLHYVTTKGITTLTTTAMRKVQGPASGVGKDGSVRSSAWTSVSVTSASVEGAVVGTDPKFGHALIARLSDGSLVPVNVTESRYLHEMDHLVKPTADSNDNRIPQIMNSSDAALQRMQDLPPFYEVLDPLLKKVSAGLSGMGKIVGSSTPSEKISPDQLAVALSVKARCDTEVVLHLSELRRTSAARRDLLKPIFKDQKEQAKALKKTLAKMQENMASIKEKSATAQRNAEALGLRSASVLQASQDLLPTLTQAEHDFIQQMKRMNASVAIIESGYEKLSKSIASLRTSMDDGKIVCRVQLDEATLKSADQLLRGQEDILSRTAVKLKGCEQRTDDMMRAAGLPTC